MIECFHPAMATKVPLLLILCFGVRLCSAEDHASTADVVSRMTVMDEIRLRSLHEYSSLRRYTLKNTRFGTFAEVRVRMFYQRPGEKRFEVLSETGSGLIRKSVLHRLIKTEMEASQPNLRAATRIVPQNYNFTLLGMAEHNGRRCYIVQAAPKKPTKYLFAGRLWVDAEDFAIARIEGSPAVKPSFWIRKTNFVHTYGKIGLFWLPESNNSDSDVRIYGKTIVKVEYGDYDIKAAASPSNGGAN